MSYNKVKGKIVELFGSQKEFAKALNTSEQTVTAKLKDKTQFSQNDILAWSNALGIEKADIGEYFFTD